MTVKIWATDFEVGVESLDADHIMIFSLINHIDDAHQSGCDEQAIGKMLKVLMERAIAHFKREESFMRKHNYPGLQHHAEEHRKIITDLQKLYEAYQDTSNVIASRAIVRILCSWLEEHIMKSDMHYKPYLSE